MQRSTVVDLEREGSCVVDESCGTLDRTDLRDAMLRHERMFRCQVLELLRLYWTQMNLMNGVDIGSYGSCSRPSPPVFSPSRGKEMQDMALWMHRPLMSGQTVDAPDSAMDVSFGLRPDLWRIFDIRCSAAHILAYGSATNGITFERSELESNLGVSKDDDDRNRSILKSFSCEQGSLHPLEVINSEDPHEMEIREEHKFVSPFAVKTPIPWHEMKDWFVLRGLSNSNFCGKSEKYSVNTHTKSLPFPGQEIASAKSGSFIITRQPRPTQMDAPFDLNMAQPEDPPMTVENTCVGFTLSGGSFDNRQIVEDKACKSDVKEIHSKNEANDFLIGSVGGSSFRQTSMIGGVSSGHHSNSMVINETTKSSPGGSLELNRVFSREHSTGFAEGMQSSSYGSSLTSSNSYNLRTVNADRYTDNQVSGSNSKKSELNFLRLFGTSNSPNLQVGVQEGKQLEHENSDEDTPSSKIQHLNASNLFRQQQVLPEELCAGVNSKSVIDLNCYSTECHNVKDGVFPETSRILNLETAVVGTRSALGSPYSQTHGDICHEGQDCGHDTLQDGDQLTRKKCQVEERDGAVLMAAQCLNLMSSKKPKFEELQMSGLVADEMSNQPQCSSDSLELIVLSLPENEEGECSMRVKPLEEETTKKTASRFNSRRGRQQWDFQREILPGIVSLSRHEIREDMHAFTEITRLHRINTKEKSGNIYKQNCPNTRKRWPRLSLKA